MTEQTSGAPATNHYGESTSHIALMVRPFGAPRFHLDENATTAVSGPAGGGQSDSAGAASAAIAPAGTGTDISISQAARALNAARYAKQRETEAASIEAAGQNTPTAESADAATAADELSGEDNASPETVPGETKTVDQEADKLPPIEPPRSWTKEDKDLFKGLPRDTQERIADRERSRERDFLRRQNDDAEKLKGLSAKEQQAEQVRQEYEGKLKAVVNVLENEQRRDFPDIRSMADLEKMTMDSIGFARQAAALWGTDPLAAGELQTKSNLIQATLRAWDVHQQKLQAAHHELTQAEERQRTARETDWKAFLQKENKLAVEKIPDLADEKKSATLWKAATDALQDLGFTDQDLAGFTKGEKISPFDHRFQRLMFEVVSFRTAKAAVPKVVPPTVPVVQRPGPAVPRGTSDSAVMQDLTRKFQASGSLKDAVELRAAQSRAAQRRT